jgi:prevent-host-death family protein
MTKTVEIAEAQQSLPELVDLASKGNDIIISRGAQPVARLVSIAPRPRTAHVPDLSPNSVWMAPDFDEPLPDDFWVSSDESPA